MRTDEGQVNEGLPLYNDNFDLHGERMSQGRLSVISIEVLESRRPYESLLGQRERLGEGLPSYVEACSMDITTEYQ